MIRPEFLRRLASLLLRFAIWIAPHDTHDWGHGMLSELPHVEGNWASLVWALGGTGVLAKHAMLAVIFPASHRRTVTSASELFDKEGPMRKTTLAAIGACTAASLLFFLAPVFRQAFRVSLAQWHDVLHVQLRFTYAEPDPELDALAKEAEQNHDAEALAFVAVRHPNQIQRVHFADEAVRLDPNLTWVYATAGTLHFASSGMDRVSALEQWDPKNAFPRLIAAQKIGVTVAHGKESPLGKVVENPAWEKAMNAAFQSPKLDTYLDRQKQLDHRVLSRYRLDDPFQVASDENWYGFPSYGIQNCSLYAESLLESGQTLESRGDRRAAFEKYWAVARFGQMMNTDGELTFFMKKNMQEAYSRLGALSEMEGRKVEAAFYASLSDQFDKATEQQLTLLRSRFRGSDVSHWNALLVKLSGLLILFCAVLLFLCALGIVVRSRSLRLSSFHPSRLTLGICLGAAVGALLSSAVLFVSYRPYSELFQRFLSKGDDAGLSDLSSFLRDTRFALGTQDFLGSSNVVFQFWSAVTVLCALAVLIAVFRHFQTRPHAAAA